MRYLSVCSGIEAATVAWEPLGFTPAAFSEVEPFPSAVLQHHYPNTPNLGDMTKIDGKKYRNRVDLLVGGTPCQSFSVAGLRGGLEDARGNLALHFMRLAHEARPRFVLWENVPGALSSNQGRDFGAIVGALEELGYGWAYRTLDAQYFGLAQRRKRVFLVGCLGDAELARKILFERESLRGDSPPSREARQGAASVLKIRAGCEGGGKGALIGENQAFTLATGNDQTLFTPALGIDAEFNVREGSPSFSVRCANTSSNGWGIQREVTHTLDQTQGPAVYPACALRSVRRLTPTECERLQGFPDGYTNIPWRGNPEAPDGPRYKALGNSMAVPVMRWIGERIAAIDEELQNMEPSAGPGDHLTD